MNIAINVCKYGGGRKCVYMFRYTYAGIRPMKMQMEKEDRHVSMVMRTSIGTMTYVSIKFVEREERKQKNGFEYRTEHKPYI